MENNLWEVKNVELWEEYEDLISDKNYRQWLFRGHSNSTWKLESSYYRLVKQIEDIFTTSNENTPKLVRNRQESEIISNFKAQAHLYLKHQPPNDDNLEWLTIMQHFGTPTRLLDVTFSPYVALFFALENALGQSSVYALKYDYFKNIDENSLDENYEKKLFNEQKGSKSFFIAYEPKMKNERVVAQQGAFLISSTNYQTYDQVFNYYAAKKGVCYKINFSSSFRYIGLKKLKSMNISSASLFPGLDGFCKSLKFQLLDDIKQVKRLR